MKKLILILIVMPLFLGCKKVNEEESELRVNLSKVAPILPFAIKSCEEEADITSTSKSVSPNSAKFSGLVLQWSGGDTVSVKSAKVIFESPLLKSQKLEQSFEIESMDIAGGDATDKSIDCLIRIGGIELVDDEAPAYIDGKLVILALSTNAAGEQKFVTAETDLEMQYLP